MQIQKKKKSVPAVVVGLCAHGLALCRALNRDGVEVIGLEKHANASGARTNSARVIIVDDINGHGLISHLVQLAQAEFKHQKPVLFLTNDNMIESISQQADLICQYYSLSWGHCAQATAELLDKQNIERRCHDTKLNYPMSCVVAKLTSVDLLPSNMRFPIIVKPSRPLSSFKTITISQPDRYEKLLRPHANSAPFIVQEFIPGDDRQISFCALYLDQGRTVAHFEGRKIQSRPMGHTTIAIPFSDDALLKYTERFFEGLSLSGPVSLEIKRDSIGKKWVIEPTVGRTDFWVSLCIHSGVNIPLIEYNVQCKLEPFVENENLNERVIWINGERDPLASFRLLYLVPRLLFRSRIYGVYADSRDPKPLIAHIKKFSSGMVKNAPQKFLRLSRRLLSFK